MSEPFIAEIRMFGFDFPPRGWGLCQGQLLPINQNQALFSLLGTTYGGNGQTTFALPDLRGRVPVHPGSTVALGQVSGAESHTLTANEVPQHQHSVNASAASPTTGSPAGAYLAPQPSEAIYGAATPPTTIMAGSAGAGGASAHNNMQPYLVVNFSIALLGIFPSRN